MKILFVSTRFAPHVGGVESMLKELSAELSKENSVCVLTSLNESSIKSPFTISNKTYEKDNLCVKRIWMNLPRFLMGFLIFPYRFIAGIFSIRRFIKSYNPDVVNFHFPDDASIYMYFALSFLNFPLITNIHGNDLHVFSKLKIYRFFIFQTLKKSKKIIVNSKYMENELFKVYPEFESKVEIIPNGLDLNYIATVESKKYIEEKYIFFVGRFVYKKGIDILIKAFKLANIPDLKLLLEGNGEEYSNIESLITKLNLESKVILTKGILSATEKLEYMKGSVMGIIPSRIEPFGIVALEYLACGTPVIAAKTGGLKTILEDNKTCLFFKKESVKDLSEKILLLNKSSKLRETLSKSGLKSVEKYGWKQIADSYLDIYANRAI